MNITACLQAACTLSRFSKGSACGRLRGTAFAQDSVVCCRRPRGFCKRPKRLAGSAAAASAAAASAPQRRLARPVASGTAACSGCRLQGRKCCANRMRAVQPDERPVAMPSRWPTRSLAQAAAAAALASPRAGVLTSGLCRRPRGCPHTRSKQMQPQARAMHGRGPRQEGQTAAVTLTANLSRADRRSHCSRKHACSVLSCLQTLACAASGAGLQ